MAVDLVIDVDPDAAPPRLVEGQLLAGSNGAAVPAPTFGISDGQVNIQTHIGEFQGASGIFQIAQVPGNFNVVNQNMFIQINLVEPSSVGQIF